MRQFPPLFGCSPTTVCRVIQRLRLLLANGPSAPDLAVSFGDEVRAVTVCHADPEGRE
ncbi:hypothetical protein ACIRSU_04710 [Streptomyces sp. NPDC101160]|uniref:hypothetical protein n=1 Tax=Streptomyces sp. NPDC101160 TaxID=3366118 RepID=UPI00380E9985